MKNKSKNILFEKLNNFVNKFYKNQLIKGGIITTSVFIIFFITFSIVEYFSHSGIVFRTILFWSYIFINAVVILKYIIIPFLHLYGFGEVINYKQAAKIIGSHFSEIEDKLLNILQLNELSESENDLVHSSIQQKIDEIKMISFQNAINFTENRKYLKWIVIPILFLIMFIVSGNQHILTESSARIIDYNNEYIPQAPFNFEIKNDNLNCVEHQDFNLELNLIGLKVPEKVIIEIMGNRFSMMRNNVSEFEHLFKNVISDKSFRFYADGFYSQYYTLVSIAKPTILDFNIELLFPKYTNLENENLNNIGDITVAEGTLIRWNFNLQHTDSLYIDFENKKNKFGIENNKLTINKKIKNSTSYSISTVNKNISSQKTSYSIRVIKDEYPKISLETKLDSVSNQMFFNGTISDDYSISKLEFHYTVKSEDSTHNYIDKINIQKSSKENFYHYLNIHNLHLKSSDNITYYFEVWDNDGVNGSKSVKSESLIFTELSEKEMNEKKEKENVVIKNNLDESINLAKEIKKDIEQLNKDLIEKKKLGWEEKQKVESILKKQKKLENQIRENNKKNRNKNQFHQKTSSSILEKQKQLEKLMNEVLDDESKKLMEEMQKLLDDTDREKMKELLDKMGKDNTDLEKELDRNLELFKQLEFEQKLEEIIEKINQLKDKQKELKDKTEKNNSNLEKLKQEQEKLQEELKDLVKDLKNLEEKNSELEEKKVLPDTDKEEEEASESMEKSKESLQKKQKRKSAKEQEKTIEQFEKMEEKLQSLQQSCSEDKPIEDMETLRQILENLITLSFEQEQLMNSIKNLPKNSSSIVKYIQQQKKLSDDSKIIEDSLLALSKRVIQIESIINKEISSINYNIDQSISILEERNLSKGVSKQQFVMTSVNNLALLLSETLKQMQMESSCSSPGTKQCNKPGNSPKPSLSELKKMQKKLMDQMKSEKGEKGKKKGENSKKLSDRQSMKIMKMAQQQEQIRQYLQDLRDEIGKSGDKGNLDRIIEKMEENETDILNNNITNETLIRQEEILTRLLEAENADREKEEEKKRESIEWNYKIENNNSDYLEYLKIKEQQEELLKTTPIQLSPFYKHKVDLYFNEIIKEDR